MTDATQRARELARKLRHAVMSAPPDINADEAMEPILRAAILQQQAETWRAASKIAQGSRPIANGNAFRAQREICTAIANKCEAKAQEREAPEPGAGGEA